MAPPSTTDRTVDYRYAPDAVQTCTGLVDDPHETIVREEGSLNYGYERDDGDAVRAPGRLRLHRDGPVTVEACEGSDASPERRRGPGGVPSTARR